MLATSAVWMVATLQAPPSQATPPPPPQVAAEVAKGRRELGRYRWRLKTEMRVDGSPRILKVEDVHLGPDGRLVMQKTIRFERKPEPTPVPYNDPRASLGAPPSAAEE